MATSQRDVRNRISAVKNIQKITRAMEMVAAARLRRAEQRIEALRPYAGADDVRVERPGQATVAGHEQQPDRPDLVVLGEDRQAGHVAGGLRRLTGHAADRAGIRT